MTTLFVRNINRFFLAIGLAFAIATTPLPALAGGFSDAQKGEIGAIVRDYLIKNPQVMREVFAELERVENAEKEVTAKSGIIESRSELFKSKHSFVAGNAEGDVTMIEFFDYNCGYCKRAFPDVMTLIKSDPKLRVVIKEFPILGKGSMFAARAAIASKAQDKYWDFHVAMMESKGSLNENSVMQIAAKTGLNTDKLRTDMDAENVKQEIAESHMLANRLGINGTPSFIIDDRLIPGALGLDQLRSQIAEVREGGGCKVC
jgi:protein-disulfide isomerase